MLLIFLAILSLAASFNAEKVADWYWDVRYQSDRQAAVNLLKQELILTTAAIDKNGAYEPGDLISFRIRTPDGPFKIDRYQPNAHEVGYVQRAYGGGQLLVYYVRTSPRHCVLSPTVVAARNLVNKPRPSRVPGDYIARFVSLWGKVMALLLFAAGMYSMRRR